MGHLGSQAVHRGAFLSGGFITALVVNPPESKLEKRISVQWFKISSILLSYFEYFHGQNKKKCVYNMHSHKKLKKEENVNFGDKLYYRLKYLSWNEYVIRSGSCSSISVSFYLE